MWIIKGLEGDVYCCRMFVPEWTMDDMDKNGRNGQKMDVMDVMDTRVS